MVPVERLELSRARGPGDFESPASTNSTTPAPILNAYLYLRFGIIHKTGGVVKFAGDGKFDGNLTLVACPQYP